LSRNNKIRLEASNDQVMVRNDDFFIKIYEEYHGSLCAFLRKVPLPEDVVNDIAQEVYFRIIRQNKPENLEEYPRAYLYRVAINLVRDRFRSNNTRMEQYHQQLEEDTLVSSEMSPEINVHYRQQLAKLKSILRELSPKHRKIYLMHRINNATCREISKDLGISLRSVERYLSQAVAYCQVKMGEVL